MATKQTTITAAEITLDELDAMAEKRPLGT